MRYTTLPLIHPEYGGKLTYYGELKVGTRFHVCNGDWDGEIILDEGIKKVCVLIEEGHTGIIQKDDHAWMEILEEETTERQRITNTLIWWDTDIL